MMKFSILAEFSRYRTPGGTVFTRIGKSRSAQRSKLIARPERARAILGRCDQIDIQHDPDLAAQEVKQDFDPLAFRHPFEQAEK